MSSVTLPLFLLELSEDTVKALSRAIDQILAQSRMDGATHDITIGIGEASAGLTVHYNYRSDAAVTSRLAAHCEARKYTEKAERWFGISIRPEDGSLRFGLKIEYPWKQSGRMDELVRHMPAGKSRESLIAQGSRNWNVGRNAPCPCGSGKKYKKCCLNRRNTA